MEGSIHPDREAYSYRHDPAVPAFPDDRPIIVFDGKCVFCSRLAQFILKHDRAQAFRLMAAQTPLGAALYIHYGLDPLDYETNILIEDGRAWLKSEGTIRMFERLGLPWSRVGAPPPAGADPRSALRARGTQPAPLVRRARHLLRPCAGRRRPVPRVSGGLRILVVGGYGTFGGRLIELLERDARLTLIVAGRSLGKAREFCRRRGHTSAALIPMRFDRDGDLDAELARHTPSLVVDASGPFQGYGDKRYRLIEACIVRGIDYLDLADASDFVAGVVAFDAAARQAGVFVLSGVSSFPVLTAAVVRHLAGDMGSLVAIRAGVAPSPYAGVGENVIRAIASYAGRPITLPRNGVTATAYPITETMRYTIAPPGRVPLRSTLFSLVDVPDLRTLPALWPEVRSVWMGAGPVPEALHRLLIGLAWLVRWGLLPTLAPLASIMHRAINRLGFGEHRGGMFVEVDGTDPSGAPLRRSWHLLAEGDDGPLIPSMAAAAIVGRMLGESRPAPGARAAVSDLELTDYALLFAGRAIYTGVREDGPGRAATLYARLLGSAWDRVPAEIRTMHNGVRAAEGVATVERGRGRIANLITAAVGFPRPGAGIPVRVRFDASSTAEVWTRTFDGQSFRSRQFMGRGRMAGLLCERFGPFTFGMALVPEHDRLRLILRRWTAFGVALPLRLGPRSNSYAAVEDGRFRFHVEVSHPFTGLIVRYQGWLVPWVNGMTRLAFARSRATSSRRT